MEKVQRSERIQRKKYHENIARIAEAEARTEAAAEVKAEVKGEGGSVREEEGVGLLRLSPALLVIENRSHNFRV